MARDFSTAFVYCGSATDDKIPMIKTTTNNSISVKPFIFVSPIKKVILIGFCAESTAFNEIKHKRDIPHRNTTGCPQFIKKKKRVKAFQAAEIDRTLLTNGATLF